MADEQIFIILLGALLGGFVSGLTGFGTGITAMGIWLYSLSPTITATLVICCSIVSQLQTLPMLFKALSFKRVLPFLIPAIIAVPIGTHLLVKIDGQIFKLGIGCLLVIYAVISLFLYKRSASIGGGRFVDGLVGFGGGILGGISGLSGILPVIWSKFRGWSKDQRRSTFQLFNLTILSIALLSHAYSGFVNAALGIAVMIALPGTMLGSWLGSRMYKLSSDIQYEFYVLVLLLLGGIILIATTI